MKNKFAENFKVLRVGEKLKQADLAAKLQVTQRKISYWESGKIEPDIDALFIIADYFDISVDELIGRKELF